MLIVPGATAHLLTDRFGRMLLIAPTISVLASVTGIFLSYWVDASSGGLIVLVQGALFTAVYLLAPRYGVLPRLRISSPHRRPAVRDPAEAADRVAWPQPRGCSGRRPDGHRRDDGRGRRGGRRRRGGRDRPGGRRRSEGRGAGPVGPAGLRPRGAVRRGCSPR